MWNVKWMVLATAFWMPSPARNESPVKEESVIYWSPKTKLIGSDFKRPPLKESHFSAGSHLGTGLEISADNNHLRFTVKAYFVPDKSWIKVNDTDLLKHEQAHFDIEEYYARLIRKELGRIQVKGRPFDAVRAEADEMFARMLAERTRCQDLFDEETGHSVKTDKEKEWEDRIGEQLRETRAYASPELYFAL